MLTRRLAAAASSHFIFAGATRTSRSRETQITHAAEKDRMSFSMCCSSVL